MSDSTAVRQLAAAFITGLRECVTAEDMAEILRRNATPQYGRACATHDFCDANIVMYDAYVSLFGELVDLDDDNVNWVLDRAWDLARAVDFEACRLDEVVA
jgi:hypothetical protein